jgi:hypothetical protein
MNQNQRDVLARQLDIPADEQAVLDAGSEHPFHCRCAVCLTWWVLMGPDGEPDDPGAYGPFTKREVDAERARGQQRYDKE